MEYRPLGNSGLKVPVLCLGAMTFGEADDKSFMHNVGCDEKTSFAILDAFIAGGFTAVDTADVYSRWVPGNDGDSEKIIGRWMKARGNRDKVHVLTKVGSDVGQGKRDLSAKWIETAVEASLTRLQTDYIDLYQSHWPDPTATHEETLGAYERLIRAGKVRHVGCSNYDEALLTGALEATKEKGLPRYETVQNEYNLYTRNQFEGAVQDFVIREGMSLIPYSSLASGFLTGKYRSKDDLAQSPRGGGIGKYLDDRGVRILAAMDEVSETTGAAHADIALAWINAQPGVAAAIASATSLEQLDSLMRGARLVLDAASLARLTDAGN